MDEVRKTVGPIGHLRMASYYPGRTEEGDLKACLLDRPHIPADGRQRSCCGADTTTG